MGASASSNKITGSEFLVLMQQYGLDLQFQKIAKLTGIASKLRDRASGCPTATLTLDLPNCKETTVNQYISKLKLGGKLADYGLLPISVNRPAGAFAIQFEKIPTENSKPCRQAAVSLFIGLNPSIAIVEQLVPELENEFLSLGHDCFSESSINRVPGVPLYSLFIENICEDRDLQEHVEFALRDSLVLQSKFRRFAISRTIRPELADAICIGIAISSPDSQKNEPASLDIKKATRSAQALFKKCCSQPDLEKRHGLPSILCSNDVVSLVSSLFDFHPQIETLQNSQYLDNLSDYIPEKLRYESDILRSKLTESFSQQNVVSMKVSAGDQIDLIAYQAKAFAKQLTPERLVLDCDFHKTRQHDLLGGIIRAIARTMNLELACLSKYGGIRNYIDAWCSRHLDILQLDRCADVAATLHMLLVGTIDDSELYRWAKVNLKQVLLILAKTKPILMVVKDANYVDELSTVMLDCLIKRSSQNDNIQILLLHSNTDQRDEDTHRLFDGDDVRVPTLDLKLTEDLKTRLSKDAIRVGEIAVVLGWGFPRYWLRDLFRDLNKYSSDKFFDAAVGELIAYGVLRYDGHNYDLRNPNLKCRRLTFGSFSAYDSFAVTVEIRSDILRCFFNSLAEKISEIEKDRNLSHKNIICEYLVECQDLNIIESLGPLRVAKLWHFVAQQAYTSDANEEARYRSVNALHFLHKFVQIDKMPHDDIGANFEICTLYLNVMARCNQMCEDHNQFSCQCNSIGDTVASILDIFLQATHKSVDFITNEIGIERWFSLGRSLWSWHQRWGNLDIASDLANSLKRVVAGLAKKETRLDLMLESYHLLVVTCFVRGRFEDCIAVADDAQEAFGKTDSLPLKKECELHGSHNGYACCMLLSAFSEVCREGGDDKKVLGLLNRVAGFTIDQKQLCGDNTKYIVAGYINLIASYNLTKKSNQIQSLDLKVNLNGFRLNSMRNEHEVTTNRWATFCLLSELSFEICEQWNVWLNDGRPSKDLDGLISRFDRQVKLWRAADMKSYWMLNQARLFVMQGIFGSANELLKEANEFATKRGENFCQKELIDCQEVISNRSREESPQALSGD